MSRKTSRIAIAGLAVAALNLAPAVASAAKPVTQAELAGKLGAAAPTASSPSDCRRARSGSLLCQTTLPAGPSRRCEVTYQVVRKANGRLWGTVSALGSCTGPGRLTDKTAYENAARAAVAELPTDAVSCLEATTETDARTVPAMLCALTHGTGSETRHSLVTVHDAPDGLRATVLSRAVPRAAN